jgi:CDGSH-type Zn-finger protein/uncharacterized Fe-S cluster protein YjdI
MSSKVEEVRGQRVVIHFDAGKCIHSRNCVLGRPDVFVPNVQGEWIHPDAATPDEVAELAHNCPSGAITYERLDGGPAESQPLVNTVRMRENGPLALHASITICGEAAGLRATLCRCGASRHKPYCDGSHTTAGFAATGEPAGKASEAIDTRNGALAVTTIKNGPLKLDGAHEIVSGTGRTLDRCAQSFLCRCGHSAGKPYCDGTHKKIGFEADGCLIR